jgi:hypothetical protein
VASTAKSQAASGAAGHGTGCGQTPSRQSQCAQCKACVAPRGSRTEWANARAADLRRTCRNPITRIYQAAANL